MFAILPTGHKKSILFQLLPDVCKYLCLSGYSYPPHAIILVVCPLKSLVDSHLRELRNRGISAASLSSEDVDENDLLKRTYSFVFGSPESFLQNEKWRNTLRSDVYQDNLRDRYGLFCEQFPGTTPFKLVADKHVITELPLVPFVIINLTSLTASVCMKMRFKSKVTRGFSFFLFFLSQLSHAGKNQKNF